MVCGKGFGEILDRLIFNKETLLESVSRRNIPPNERSTRFCDERQTVKIHCGANLVLLQQPFNTRHRIIHKFLARL